MWPEVVRDTAICHDNSGRGVLFWDAVIESTFSGDLLSEVMAGMLRQDGVGERENRAFPGSRSHTSVPLTGPKPRTHIVFTGSDTGSEMWALNVPHRENAYVIVNVLTPVYFRWVVAVRGIQ